MARYAERVHNPDRLTEALLRTGPKGSGQFTPIGMEEALDRVADGLLAAEARHGPEAVWPYFYAGTMGLVMRDGINRLRHAKRYSDQYSTICTALSWAGYMAGNGRMTGADPREMERSDCIVLWGTNAVVTQVNVMTHAVRARKARGAPIVAVDIYDNATLRQADVALIVRPGTDGALACGIMHVLFRDGFADRAYLDRYADDPAGLEAHLATRTPEWARRSAACRPTTSRPWRICWGDARAPSSASATASPGRATGPSPCMPSRLCRWCSAVGNTRAAAPSIRTPACSAGTSALIEGLDLRDAGVRRLDQSRIGAMLTGEASALQGGPPVTALFIQNTNPVSVAPDQEVVKRGFARPDLFTVVHEQIMTDTARMADIVLPATMFVEHDDVYQGGGQSHILLGPKLIDPPGSCRVEP